jgi:hypothetical protein
MDRENFVAITGESDYPTPAQTDSEQEEDDEDSEVLMVEKWGIIVDAIIKSTRKAFSSSPAFDSASPAEFQSYWHGVFLGIRDSIASDPTMPEMLTSPSAKKFKILLFDAKHGLGCPCCLPNVDANIALENEEGVTKLDFIEGLAKYLYGSPTALPTVYGRVMGNNADSEADHSASSSAGTLIYAADWMSMGRQHGSDEKLAYVHYEDTMKPVLKIWLYCCEAGNFEDLIKEKESRKTEGEAGKNET